MDSVDRGVLVIYDVYTVYLGKEKKKRVARSDEWKNDR